MAIVKAEIRPRLADGTYNDIVYPKTSIDMVDGLQTALNGKANSSHTHTRAQVGLSNVNNWGASSSISANSTTQYATTNMVAQVRSEKADRSHSHEIQLREGSIANTTTIQNIVDSMPVNSIGVYDIAASNPEFFNSAGTLLAVKRSNSRIQLYFSSHFMSSMYFGVYHPDQLPRFKGWKDMSDADTLSGRPANQYINTVTTTTQDLASSLRLGLGGSSWRSFISCRDFDNVTHYSSFATGSRSGQAVAAIQMSKDSTILARMELLQDNNLMLGDHTVYHTGNKPTKADIGLSSVNNWGASSSISANSTSQYATTNMVAQVRAEKANAAHNHSSISVVDDRDENKAPGENVGRAFSVHFRRRTAVNSPAGSSTYGGLVEFAPWNNSTGGNAYQMFFGYSGTNPRISLRTGALGSSTWGSWCEMYHTENKPTKADVGLSNVPNYSASDSVTSTTAAFATSRAVKLAYDRGTQGVHDANVAWNRANEAFNAASGATKAFIASNTARITLINSNVDIASVAGNMSEIASLGHWVPKYTGVVRVYFTVSSPGFSGFDLVLSAYKPSIRSSNSFDNMYIPRPFSIPRGSKGPRDQSGTSVRSLLYKSTSSSYTEYSSGDMYVQAGVPILFTLAHSSGSAKTLRCSLLQICYNEVNAQ